jgi:glucose/arabinose dehydrogenase
MLPDGRFLITQRSATGGLNIVTQDGAITPISGLPTNIGVLDVELAPDFTTSHMIYFSYMVRDTSEPRVGRAKDDLTTFPERMMVARATLAEASGAASLSGVSEIFRQVPTICTFPGSGEPGGRIAFSPDGQKVFITSGDRQELDSTFLFSLDNNLGKTVRLNLDGSIPSDNPYVGTAGARGEIWTLGHRNQYGLIFIPDGRLIESEMGPNGGDELNVILPAKNYGWPAVSYGDNYGTGGPLPKPAPGDGFEPSPLTWTPVIAPAGMLLYKGDQFPNWKGDLLLTGLASKALVRVHIDGATATEVQRINVGARTRDIVEGPGGALWIITDGTAGELRKITPVF